MATTQARKNKDGKTIYYVRVVTGYKTNGTPIQERRKYDSKREADLGAKAWETEIARGLAGGDGRMPLKEYLDEWLTRKARSARPISVDTYKYLIDHCIKDTPLSATPLGKLTPPKVQKWIDGIARPATARKARAVLNIALNEATRLGHIAVNPVSRTTQPAHTPAEGQAWTAEQTKLFLRKATGELYAPYWQIAAYLGMRPSEIIALRWESVDLVAGTLKVERAMPSACGKQYTSETTKSPSGKRTLALPPALVAILRAHCEEQKELRPTVLGKWWAEPGLVCTSSLGVVLEARNVQTRFHKLRKAAGLPLIRLYDLRHTATSLMLDAGADLKAASEALGHSDPRITMKVYRHVRADQRAMAITLLADAISEPEIAAAK
jgi:integrase